MVWSQYVDEATIGFDADISDDDEFADSGLHTIEDWEVEYSDELSMMWGIIRTLLYDAGIEHTCEFIDFVEFCYTEHDPYVEMSYFEHHDLLLSIWAQLRRVIHNNHLHEEMMRGASVGHFFQFMAPHIINNNVMLC